jgi:hypothetical protein
MLDFFVISETYNIINRYKGVHLSELMKVSLFVNRNFFIVPTTAIIYIVLCWPETKPQGAASIWWSRSRSRTAMWLWLRWVRLQT